MAAMKPSPKAGFVVIDAVQTGLWSQEVFGTVATTDCKGDRLQLCVPTFLLSSVPPNWTEKGNIFLTLDQSRLMGRSALSGLPPFSKTG